MPLIHWKCRGTIKYFGRAPLAVLLILFCGLPVGSVAGTVVVADDFEPDIDQSEWSAFGGVVLATNFGGSVSGTNSLWFGGEGMRFATTRPVDATGGKDRVLSAAFGRR